MQKSQQENHQQPLLQLLHYSKRHHVKLGFSVNQTMMIAQKLYEAGRITYMRTDSKNLSEDALAAAELEIKNLYGEKFAKKRTYNKKSKEHKRLMRRFVHHI